MSLLDTLPSDSPDRGRREGSRDLGSAEDNAFPQTLLRHVTDLIGDHVYFAQCCGQFQAYVE